MTNYDKLGQEKTIEMCFPFCKWIPDRIMTKYNEITKKLTNKTNNKADIRTLRINARGQKRPKKQ